MKVSEKKFPNQLLQLLCLECIMSSEILSLSSWKQWTMARVFVLWKESRTPHPHQTKKEKWSLPFLALDILAKFFQTLGHTHAHIIMYVLISKPVWQCFPRNSSSAFGSIYYTGEEGNGKKRRKKWMALTYDLFKLISYNKHMVILRHSISFIQ